MCENCEKLIETWKGEIASAATEEGEFYDRIVAYAVEAGHGDDSAFIQTTAADAIAVRAAQIAQFTTDGEFHTMPTSLILGAWAGEALNIEMAHDMREQMKSRLGMSDN